MKLARKLVATILVVGLVMSSFTISFVHADAVDDLVNRLLRIYNAIKEELPESELAAIQDARANLGSLTNEDWTTIIGTDLETTMNEKLIGVEAKDIIGSMVDIFLDVQGNLTTNVQDFRTDYAASFDQLFGTDLTVDTLLSVVASIEENITEPEYMIQLISTDDLNDYINTVITATIDNDYPELDGILSENLGIGILDIIAIKDRLNAEIDPDSLAMNAFIQGAVLSKNGTIDGEEEITIGEYEYTFKIDYQGESTNIFTGFIDWETSNTAIAEFDSGNTLTAKASGEVTIYANLLGLTLAQKTVTVLPSDAVIAPGVGGGGGAIGGGAIGDPEAPSDNVETVVQVATSSNSAGQVVATATIDEEQLLNDIKENNEILDIQITIEENVNVVDVELSANVLTEIANNNANNTVSVVINQGSYTLPVQEVAKVLNDLLTQGEDIGKAKVTIRFGEALDSEQAMIAQEVSEQGATALTGVFNAQVQITIDEKTYPVNTFNTFVTTTFNIAGILKANQVVGVQWVSEANTTAKKAGVQTASIKGELIAAPTLIAVSDDQTVIKIKQRYSAPVLAIKNQKTFEDVSPTFWGKADIELLASKLVIKGRTDEQFVPNGKITRAEFATLIVRALGLSQKTTNEFEDVKNNDWFAGYVGAAAQAGIVTGLGDRAFKPDQQITRQEAATMIVRAYEYLGETVALTTVEKQTELAKFNDNLLIQDWAKEYVAKNTKLGIIQGDNNSNFNPLADATRAESAAMLKRLMLKAKLLSE